MNVEILEECGYKTALFGLGLSYDITSGYTFDAFCNDKDVFYKVYKVSRKLFNEEGGHNKFLESIQVWLDIMAPRYWYAEFDTYRVGCSKQSQSTIHTLMKRPLIQDDFETRLPTSTLQSLRTLQQKGEFENLKNELPEGFLQRRIINLNYKVLRNIIQQRKNHKLKQWQIFCSEIYTKCEHPEYFSDLMNV